jgi:hypothetical protein
MNQLLWYVIFIPIGIMIVELIIYGLNILWKWFIGIEQNERI